MMVSGNILTAGGASYDATGNDLNITASTVDFNSTIAGVDGLSLTATTGDMTITGNFNNTGELGLTVTKGFGTINQPITSGGAVTISAKNGIEINADITAAGIIDIDADNSSTGIGDLTVAGGTTINSNGNLVYIKANDLILNGSISSGQAVTKFDSDASGIGLGNVSSGGGFNVSGSELQRVSALELTLLTQGDITVAGITDPESDNIDVIILDAAGTITFTDTASIFNTLDVQAQAGVVINADLTTDVGELMFNTDPDSISGGSGGITFGNDVTVTSATVLTLGGGNGSLTGAGNVNIQAEDGITFNSSLNTAGITQIISDVSRDGTGDLIIAADTTIATDSNPLYLTVNDLHLVGLLDSGTDNTTITVSDNADIALGTGSAGFFAYRL